MDRALTTGHILQMINQKKFLEIIQEGVQRHQSKAKLAKAIGVSTKTVYDWLGGAIPKLDNVASALEKMGIDAESAGVIPRRPATLGPSAQEYFHVPYLDVEVSAGTGLVSYGAGVKSYLAFQTQWLHEAGVPDKMVAVQVRGDSMEPLIYDGDVALVDTSQTEVINDRIYAVVLHGTVRLKRLFTGSRAYEEFCDTVTAEDLAEEHEVPVEGHGGDVDFLTGTALRDHVWENEYADLAVASDNYRKYQTEFVEKYYKPGVAFYIIGRAVWLGRDIRRA